MADDLRPIYVISDAHLDVVSTDAERVKSERLLAFWRLVEDRQADLVILGDLFDFWFEFKNAIPRYHFEHLMALRRLIEAGRKVWYVAGNHDFWAGPFLRDRLGIEYCADELELNYSGRRLCFAHGDGWMPGEHGYRLMKRVFRNRLSIAMFRLISPDIGFPLARWVSGQSRQRRTLPPRVIDTYTRIAQQRLSWGIDALFTGHLHTPLHCRWPEGEWICTGDWIEHFTYVVIDGLDSRLMRWQDGGAHARVEHVRASELRLEPASRP
jgi:UDP-2,3-diacylglucosamine hydrolase